jgi:hypothetical protein
VWEWGSRDGAASKPETVEVLLPGVFVGVSADQDGLIGELETASACSARVRRSVISIARIFPLRHITAHIKDPLIVGSSRLALLKAPHHCSRYRIFDLDVTLFLGEVIPIGILRIPA